MVGEAFVEKLKVITLKFENHYLKNQIQKSIIEKLIFGITSYKIYTSMTIIRDILS